MQIIGDQQITPQSLKDARRELNESIGNLAFDNFKISAKLDEARATNNNGGENSQGSILNEKATTPRDSTTTSNLMFDDTKTEEVVWDTNADKYDKANNWVYGMSFGGAAMWHGENVSISFECFTTNWGDQKLKMVSADDKTDFATNLMTHKVMLGVYFYPIS